ncbi:CTA8 Heat shock transcription factor [Candida maltosa Xu316]
MINRNNHHLNNPLNQQSLTPLLNHSNLYTTSNNAPSPFDTTTASQFDPASPQQYPPRKKRNTRSQSKQQQQQQQQQSNSSNQQVEQQSQSQQQQQQQGSSQANQRKKKESTGPKTRPAFVMKIWSMVNDPANHEYIRWNDDGKTFQVFHREDFMKIILPKYFKHNNFASFVRQLNMYGWHKVQDISNGTLNQSCDKNGAEEIWQFENANFIRDREDLLDKIIRNKSTSTQDDIGVSFNNVNNAANLSLVLQELESIKMNQYAISEDLRRVRQDNKMLWQENYLNRERNQVQGRTLDKILKFLSVVYGNNANQLLNGYDGPTANMNNSMTQYRQSPIPASPLFPRSQTQPPPEDYFHNNEINNNTSNNNHAEPMSSSASVPVANGNDFDHHYPPGFPQQRPRLMLANKAYGRRPSSSRTKSTPEGSIEEIIRSYSNDKAAESNVNRMYQQLVGSSDPNQVSSPRNNFLQDLNLPNTPKNYDELEKNINNQGHSIQQVQDWIEKLVEEQHNKYSNNNNNNNNNNDDEFDVNEFLKEAATPGAATPGAATPGNVNGSNVNSPVVITPGSSSDGSNNRKRSIREVNDN